MALKYIQYPPLQTQNTPKMDPFYGSLDTQMDTRWMHNCCTTSTWWIHRKVFMLVNIKKRVKLNGKWTFVAIPKSAKGRLQPERVTDPGTYYLEWRSAGNQRKRIQEPVGSDPRAALDALAVKQGLLDNPPEPEAEQPAVPEGTLLVNACEQFLRDTKATKSEATYLTYGTQLKWFLQRTTKITAGGS